MMKLIFITLNLPVLVKFTLKVRFRIRKRNFNMNRSYLIKICLNKNLVYPYLVLVHLMLEVSFKPNSILQNRSVR